MDEDDLRALLATFADPVEFLAGLFFLAPAPYAVYDANGRCVLTNPAFRRMFGRAPPPEYDLRKDPIAASYGLLDLVDRAFAGETVHTSTFWYDPRQLLDLPSEGARGAWISVTAFPVGRRPEGGEAPFVVLAFQDVTAERLASAEAEAERDLLRAIVDQSALGIVVCDEQGRVRIINRAARQQHGTAAVASEGDWLEQVELLTAEGTPLPREELPLYRALRGETVEEATWKVRRPDGQVRTLLGSATPLRGQGGAVLVSRDVTERELAEERVRRSEERYRSLLEATTSIIFSLGADGTFVEDQPAWQRFTGLTAEQTRGWGWLDAVHPDDRKRVRESWTEAVARSSDRWSATHRLRRHDGAWRWVDVHAVRLREADGSTREWVGIGTDVTEARMGEELRRFLAGLGAGLDSDVDPEETVRAAAGRAVPLLGDACFVDFVNDDGTLARVAVEPDRPDLPEPLRRADPHGAVPERAAMLRSPTRAALAEVLGSEQDADALLALGAHTLFFLPMRTRDRTVGRVVLVWQGPGREDPENLLTLSAELAARAALVVENVRLYRTAREAAERAEAASRAKDEFLAVLGHELRNPLAPIGAAIALLRRRSLPGVDRELDVLERQVTHVERLVDDLLDVSRITRGKIELDVRPADVREVVREAVELVRSHVEARGQHLRVDLDRAPATWPLDATRTKQVLVNLLSNASKYTPEGGHVEVVAEGGPDELVLRVSDDGVGLAPEQLATIFEPFVQARQDLGRARGGLGLGLTIVRSLVELHGGRVTASSEGPDRGSTFEVRLPRVSAVSEPSPEETAPPPTGPRRRVLLVDDNRDAADLMAELVREWGHEARVAYDGPSALRVLENFEPDVIVLDIGLPGMDGYEVARRIRRDARFARARLVALTGYGQPTDVERSKEAGFDEHLVKPVDLDVLEALFAQ